MMHYNELVPAQPALLQHADHLRLAVAAYLARFKGTSRDHADSDLRYYLTWCADRSLDPFLARRFEFSAKERHGRGEGLWRGVVCGGKPAIAKTGDAAQAGLRAPLPIHSGTPRRCRGGGDSPASGAG